MDIFKNGDIVGNMWLLSLCIAMTIVLTTMSGKLSASEWVEYKGQLSGEYTGLSIVNSKSSIYTLRYIPDLTLQQTLAKNGSWDFNISANLYSTFQTHVDRSTTHKADLYRINSSYQTLQSDFRLGLQKINFGPALLLRPLRWFDQVSPVDPLKLTDGVKGIRYRYVFLNNANIWFWILYGNSQLKGYEQGLTVDHTPELGGRYQFPLSSGELGVSYHQRKTLTMGYSGDDLGHDLIERRVAIDGKWDIGAGVWFEYVQVDQGASSQSGQNWISMLSIGTDYTFSYGNGLHTLLEHMLSTSTDQALRWYHPVQASALQLSYPMTILDSISFITLYSWKYQQAFNYARWSRSYDNWAINLSAFLTSSGEQQASDLLSNGTLGDGIQLTLVYNH